jgi:hypothetical protein
MMQQQGARALAFAYLRGGFFRRWRLMAWSSAAMDVSPLPRVA